MDEIEKLNEDKYYGALYDVEKENKKMMRSYELIGEERGIIKGSTAAREEIAKSLLEENIDINTISKCTGLSIEEINNL